MGSLTALRQVTIGAGPTDFGLPMNFPATGRNWGHMHNYRPSYQALAPALALVLMLLCGGCILSMPLLKRVSPSPTGVGEALLVTDNSSPAGASAWIYVNDPKRSDAPVRIGGSYASDGSVKLHRAIWSRDGTILAVQAEMGETHGKSFEGAYTTRYVAAYDFLRHEVLTATKPPAEFSKQTRDLLRARGGTGKVDFEMPYDASGKPVSPMEARHYSR